MVFPGPRVDASARKKPPWLAEQSSSLRAWDALNPEELNILTHLVEGQLCTSGISGHSPNGSQGENA